MQLAIGRPVSGWLPVYISIGGQSSSFRASGVVNDPLTEFITAALWCLDTEYQMPAIESWMNSPHSEPGERGIHFWLEPAWHSLLLLKVKGSDDIRLRFYVNHTGGLFVDEDDFCTSVKTGFGSVTAMSFAKAVYMAISESSLSDIRDFEKFCGKGFPYAMFQDLEVMVRNL